MRLAWLALIALAALFAPPAPAAEREAQTFAMVPGKAYILFRASRDKHFYFGLTLARALTGAETERYLAEREAALARYLSKPEPKDPFRFDYKQIENVVVASPADRIEKGDSEAFLLTVEPGTYVILGSSFMRYAGTCVCMGSVRFEAAAGTITDMGTIELQIALDPLKFESLKDYVGWPVRGLVAQPPPLAMTVRPPDAGTRIPALIAGQPIRPAEYHAAGKMPNYLHTRIIRMAPVPGILGYDADRVIDLRTGTEAR